MDSSSLLRMKLLQKRAQRTNNTRELRGLVQHAQRQAKTQDQKDMAHTIDRFMGLLDNAPPKQRAARVRDFLGNLDPKVAQQLQQSVAAMGAGYDLDLEGLVQKFKTQRAPVAAGGPPLTASQKKNRRRRNKKKKKRRKAASDVVARNAPPPSPASTTYTPLRTTAPTSTHGRTPITQRLSASDEGEFLRQYRAKGQPDAAATDDDEPPRAPVAEV